jgi:hypothetical protein
VRVRALGGAATLFASAALFLSARASGYADGAPAGFSGGFGEESCHACHFNSGLNSGAGRVTIAGLPERVVAGERYPFTVTLTRPTMKLGGFQLTARLKGGGTQAGTLAPAPGEEKRIGVDVQGNVQYANQRRAGATVTAEETARWSLVWMAPATSGPVVFHVAANAANADDTAEGDYVHTTAVEVSAGDPGPQSP